MAERRALLRDPGYRAWFRRQWESWLLPRVFHRDLGLSEIVASPDPSLVGRSFADVARDRGVRPVETFLDLCAEHGDALRWHTVIANDRPRELRRILAHPDVMIGFSDAGAHLRNMAFYNFGLRMLKLARDAAQQGVPYMPVERAVHRVTGELAGWLGLDAGTIAVGRRADLAIVDPTRLDDRLDAFETATVPELGGVLRMVNRHDDVVDAVVVGGRVAVRRGIPDATLGRVGFGRFLAASETVDARHGDAAALAS
jgi:N-acyl-D-aspartate/D-glutamate deacylase